MLRNEDYGFTKVAYTVNETLGLLSIGRTQLYEQVKNGRLKPTKVGRRTIFISYDIAAFLNAVRAENAQ